jgi:flagellar basal body rod protein FlgG
MHGIAWAANAMSAAQARLEIAAENLANGSSDGFRRSIALTPAACVRAPSGC